MPTINFKKMTKAENIEIIKWAFFEENETLNIYKYTINLFPELANIDKQKVSKEYIFSIIEEVVSKKYDKIAPIIDQEVRRYSNIWHNYNDKYFAMLINYFNIKWPNNKNIINASVGIIPVYPRYLDDFGFSLSVGIDDAKIVELSTHETLHFAWFIKWKQLYPETERREYDSPFIPWKYSEMVTDPILNNKPFTLLFSSLFQERGYDSFYHISDNGELVMDKLRKIFSKDISVETKIKEGYDYILQLEANHTKNK